MERNRKVREMRDAETVLNIIRDRGKRGLPLERLYRELYNPSLYLRAYGKLIWSGRSEVVQRLLAQECELCGSKERIEVHHVRKLADLERKGRAGKPQWARNMAARCRKTLVICQSCHNDIHYGRCDRSLSACSKTAHRRAT
jgi:hypothetical protein